jgi:hypothetical protein
MVGNDRSDADSASICAAFFYDTGYLRLYPRS